MSRELLPIIYTRLSFHAQDMQLVTFLLVNEEGWSTTLAVTEWRQQTKNSISYPYFYNVIELYL